MKFGFGFALPQIALAGQAAEPENLIPASEDFSAAGGFWLRNDVTQGADIAAPPFATGDAQQFYGAGASTLNVVYKYNGWELWEAKKYCFSLYVKDNGSDGKLDLSLQGNGTRAVSWTWGSGIPSNATPRTGVVDAYGFEYFDVPSGWWRLFIAVDNTSGPTGGDLRPYISVDDYSANTTDGMYIWGAQMDAGVLAPRPYISTP